MKLRYLTESCYDKITDIEEVKKNLDKYKDNSPWLPIEYNNSNYFEESNKFTEEFELDNECNLDSIDIINCRILYDALKCLTDRQASNAYFWTYLSHTNPSCWLYIQKRWPLETGEENYKIGRLNERYICKETRSGMLRNGLSRLWWAARLSYDETRTNKYELTEILLEKEDLFVGMLERDYSMCSNIQHGVLEALKEYKIMHGSLPNTKVCRELFKHINRIGSVTLLDKLSKSDVIDLTESYLASYV